MISRKIDRSHLRRCLPICHLCQHFAAYDSDGNCGCLLLRSNYNICPGKIGKHLLHGKGCLANPPLFLSAKTENPQHAASLRAGE